MSKTIRIKGMSCGHCAQAVTKALEELDGMMDVRVDLDAGTADYEESKPVDPELIRKAVEKAGYQLD